MMSKVRVAGLFLVIALLAAALPALAKGPMPVTITGPGLPAAGVDIGDVEQAAPFSMAALEDFRAGAIEQPAWAVAGSGYLLERYGMQGAVRRVFDRVIYYPHPGGLRSVVYYVGIHNGSSAYDGMWYHATPEGDTAMRALIAAHGARASSRPARGWSLGLRPD